MRFRTLLLLAILSLIVKARCEIVDGICETINKNVKLEMRATLILPKQLFIITKDWLVHTVQIDNPKDINARGINLVNNTAIPIAKVWTDFATNKEFDRLKDKIKMIFSLEDRYIYFFIINQTGFKYDLKENKLGGGLYYNCTDHCEDKSVAPVTKVALNKAFRFYTLEYHPSSDKNVKLVIWDLYDSSEQFQLNTTKSMQLYANSTQISSKNTNGLSKLTSDTMQAINGIISDNLFIVFTPKKIFKFYEAVVNDAYNSVDFTQSNLTDLFICSKARVVTGKTPNQVVTKKMESGKPMKIIFGCAGIVVIILLIAAVIYLAVKSKQKKHKKNKSSHKNVPAAVPSKNKSSAKSSKSKKSHSLVAQSKQRK